ncbi:MAG: penicillin-binding protein, partial [Lachnospiraceae bacterium]|nr:penicillin-binding protein [Lachnospiraceae bacterium]
YIHKGMRKVITDGSIKKLYEKLDDLEIAGKTGTAQENDYKPNHALFVSYAPYNDPEITVTTVIPNGYTSGNAAELARDIYRYYYKVEDRDKILNSKVTRPENQSQAFSD